MKSLDTKSVVIGAVLVIALMKFGPRIGLGALSAKLA
jgi:hypothetical protein